MPGRPAEDDEGHEPGEDQHNQELEDDQIEPEPESEQCEERVIEDLHCSHHRRKNRIDDGDDKKIQEGVPDILISNLPERF